MSDAQESAEKERGRLAGFGIRASLVPWLEVGLAVQAALVGLALLAASTSQTVSVAATGLTCALSVATIGLVVLSAMHGDDGERRVGRLESWLDVAIAVVLAVGCLGMFFPHTGGFAETNPYSNKEKLRCTAVFVVGEEFVVPGSIKTDGLVVRAAEGEEIMPPTVLPKPGLTFVGWRYGGVGDPDVAVGTPIYLDANGTANNSVILYAEYVDSEGTAYCSCGYMEHGTFDGAAWQGLNGRHFMIAFAPVALGLFAGLVMLGQGIRRRNGEKGTADDDPSNDGTDGDDASESDDETQQAAGEALDEEAAEETAGPIEAADDIPADDGDESGVGGEEAADAAEVNVTGEVVPDSGRDGGARDEEPTL